MTTLTVFESLFLQIFLVLKIFEINDDSEHFDKKLDKDILDKRFSDLENFPKI